MGLSSPALDHAENAGPAVLIVGWVLFPITLLIFALRLVTKLVYVHKRLGLDDLLIGIAFVIEIGHTVLSTVGVHYGIGRHLDDLSDYDRTQTLMYIVVGEPFAVLSSMFGRIGFAFYLVRLLGPTDTKQRLVLRAVMVAQVMINVAVVVQLLSQCGSHITAQWDSNVVATCQSPLVETDLGYLQSSINSLCDLVLTALPFIVIRKLHLSLRVKAGLAGLLCLSLFAFIASIIKAISIKNLSVRNNFTYNMAFLTICCMIENNLVIIGASIPTLKPLLKVISGDSTGHSYGSKTGSRTRTTKQTRTLGRTTTNQSQVGLRSGIAMDVITRKTDVTIVLEEQRQSDEASDIDLVA